MASCRSQVTFVLSICIKSQKPHNPARFNMYLVLKKCVTPVKVSKFSGHYLSNRSTLDIGKTPMSSTVTSVYFTIRNTLPKSGTFLLGQPVYLYYYVLEHEEQQ
jgi:hypothetical protein